MRSYIIKRRKYNVMIYMYTKESPNIWLQDPGMQKDVVGRRPTSMSIYKPPLSHRGYSLLANKIIVWSWDAS